MPIISDESTTNRDSKIAGLKIDHFYDCERIKNVVGKMLKCLLSISETTLMIHRRTIGRKINDRNEPITLSSPSTIVEYHDYHPLIHNKITVNHN